MRFSAIRHALRNRNSSSTDAVIDPRSFFQSIPLSPLPRRLPWVISMGESAMKFKVKREERRRRTLSENNAFGYFGHTTEHSCVLRARLLRPALYDKCHSGAIPKPGKDAIVSRIPGISERKPGEGING